jgi:hypothetical protein
MHLHALHVAAADEEEVADVDEHQHQRQPDDVDDDGRPAEGRQPRPLRAEAGGVVAEDGRRVVEVRTRRPVRLGEAVEDAEAELGERDVDADHQEQEDLDRVVLEPVPLLKLRPRCLSLVLEYLS